MDSINLFDLSTFAPRWLSGRPSVIGFAQRQDTTPKTLGVQVTVGREKPMVWKIHGANKCNLGPRNDQH